MVHLISTVLFVRIKQTSKNRTPEPAIQMYSLQWVFLGKKYFDSELNILISAESAFTLAK